MRTLLFATLIASVSLIAACSSDSTKIQAESVGPSGSGGHHTQGAGGASSSSSTGSGAGGNGVGAGRVITADTDSQRLVTGIFTGTGAILEGPFVLTDIHVDGTLIVNLVVDNNACDNTSAQHVAAIAPNANGQDVHGLRLFVPAGASLCNGGDPGVYSGFKPY